MSNSPICIAKILTAHGVRGFVKVDCFLENPHELESYNPLKTSDGKEITLHLKNPIKGKFLAEIKGVTDRNDAEKYRNIELFTERDKLPEPEEGFYHSDLIGMSLKNKQDQIIGKVIAVENFGAGDLIQVQPVSGKIFYLPFTEPYVGEILDDFIEVDRVEDFQE